MINGVTQTVDLRNEFYNTVYFRRAFGKKRLTIWQDVGGNLIIDYGNMRIVDERISDGK